MQNNTYDIIVIGAGLAGLTAAAYLSKNKKKVLLLEQHSKPGGFAGSFKREGFNFDISLHNFGPFNKNSFLYKIFHEIGISDKIEYIPFDKFQKVIFPKHTFLVQKGIHNYISFLQQTFPHEAKGIEELFALMLKLREEFKIYQPYEGNLQEEFHLFYEKFPVLAKFMLMTLDEVMDEFIKDQKLKSIAANLWWACGLPPSRLKSISYTLMMLNYYDSCGGYIKGTSQKLSNAILNQIKLNNGSVVFNSCVKKIVIKDGHVKGVTTNKNRSFFAPVVISNANIFDTMLEMIQKDEISSRFRKKIKKLELSPSALLLFLGLDKPPYELGMKNHSISIHSGYDHEKSWENILDGDYKNSVFCMTDYTAFDKTAAPEGKGILNMMTLDHIKNWENLSKKEYLEKKEKTAKILIKKGEKIMPELSKHIQVLELATPLTIKRYTKNPQGAVYGLAPEVSSSGMNFITHETSVKGLFLTGAYTYPGAGYPSVIADGYKTAKTIMKKL